MPYLATITSKRQLTIPAELYRMFNLVDGNKVIISKMKEAIKLEPAVKLVDRLAGSVVLPRKFKKLSTEGIIERAKKEYFRARQK